jgi:hypothetical protein
MVIHTCKPSTREASAGRSQMQGQPRLHNEFEVSMGFIARSCLKRISFNLKIKIKNNKKENQIEI